jgi:hypothetical protein
MALSRARVGVLALTFALVATFFAVPRAQAAFVSDGGGASDDDQPPVLLSAAL